MNKKKYNFSLEFFALLSTKIAFTSTIVLLLFSLYFWILGVSIGAGMFLSGISPGPEHKEIGLITMWSGLNIIMSIYLYIVQKICFKKYLNKSLKEVFYNDR